MILKRIQLGFIHMAVAMTLVPINSTLNRIMIKELEISATLVALLASLPYLFSPIQVAIGVFADRHPFFGLRRTPYILLGLSMCVLGVILSPFAAFLLSTNIWLGGIFGLLSFGMWGMGFNFATVSYLSLATELSDERGRSRTIAMMWFMMIAALILTSIALSQMIATYTPQALIRSFWVIAAAAFILGLAGTLRLEPRHLSLSPATRKEHSWSQLFHFIIENHQAWLFFVYLTLLLVAILAQDILLEPFGAEAFGMSVQATTRITSIWGSCVLAALLLAAGAERLAGKRTVARLGAQVALAGFILIALSGILASLGTFYTGVVLLGIGTGLATVSNLSLMLDMTVQGQVGLFIGAWGMSNALSRMVGSLLAGVIRDALTHMAQDPLIGYLVVFGVEAGMLMVSLLLLHRIDVGAFRRKAEQFDMLDRVAMLDD